jgi:hypothetical protein
MTTPASLFCLNCGAANQPQARFCSACGNLLLASSEDKSPTYISSGEQTLQDFSSPIHPTGPVASPPLPGPEPPIKPDGNNRRSSYIRTILIAVVILLIIGSGLAILLINNANTTKHNNAVATEQAQGTSSARMATAAQATIIAVQATNNAAAATTVAQAQATNIASTATAVANPDLYQPVNSVLALIDPLSQPFAWTNGSNTSFGGHCQFVNGAYQISQSVVHRTFVCSSNYATYNNFAFEVRVTINQGDCGGMSIRGNSDSANSYDFQVCRDGEYGFIRYTSNKGTFLTSGNSSAINQGINQSNVIAVLANGSSFELYVNHQQIGSVTDNNYTQGAVGLIAVDSIDQTVVTYQNVRIWTIS